MRLCVSRITIGFPFGRRPLVPDTQCVGIANSDEQRICNALNNTAQNRTTSMFNNPFSPT